MSSELRDILRDAAALPSEPLDLGRALRRGRRRWAARRLGAAATSLVLIVVAAALVARMPLAERDERMRPAQPDQFNPRLTARIDVGPTPETLAVDANGVWVSVLEQELSNEGFSLVRIDPETNQVARRVPVDIPVDHLGAGEGTLW